jgi:hypothetical protein
VFSNQKKESNVNSQNISTIHDSNKINIENSQVSNSENREKKAGFGFLKKKKVENESQNNIPPIINNTNNLNSDTPQEEKKGTTGFKFIKNKTANKENNTSQNVNQLVNENFIKTNNENKLNLLTLESLMNSENLFSNPNNNQDASVLSNDKQKINIRSINENDNEDKLYLDNTPLNENRLESNLNTDISQKDKTSDSKKGFNFLKKKIDKTIEKEIEKEYTNMDDSDSKSLKSLKYNNNIKQDNISVNLDTNEDDNKSIHNANTSFITNPLKEKENHNAAYTKLYSDQKKKDTNQSISSNVNVTAKVSSSSSIINNVSLFYLYINLI